jgi:hypothetical protein
MYYKTLWFNINETNISYLGRKYVCIDPVTLEELN